MMYKNIILSNLTIKGKLSGKLDCYVLDNKRYLAFWEEDISENNIPQILDTIKTETQNNSCSPWKTIIVVGETSADFEKKDLLYFNEEAQTCVVFYLINRKKGDRYYNDSWIWLLGLNFRKYVRKIEYILSQKEF